MSTEKPSPSSSTTSLQTTILSFFTLYLTTLFSLDSWTAARNCPYRTTGTSSFVRPATTPPASGSYQAGMHGRGNAGPRSGGAGGRDVGRVDSRPPVRMGATAACGACLT